MQNHLEVSAGVGPAPEGGDFRGGLEGSAEEGVEHQHKHLQEVTVNPVTITITIHRRKHKSGR